MTIFRLENHSKYLIIKKGKKVQFLSKRSLRTINILRSFDNRNSLKFFQITSNPLIKCSFRPDVALLDKKMNGSNVYSLEMTAHVSNRRRDWSNWPI